MSIDSAQSISQTTTPGSQGWGVSFSRTPYARVPGDGMADGAALTAVRTADQTSTASPAKLVSRKLGLRIGKLGVDFTSQRVELDAAALTEPNQKAAPSSTAAPKAGTLDFAEAVNLAELLSEDPPAVQAVPDGAPREPGSLHAALSTRRGLASYRQGLAQSRAAAASRSAASLLRASV